MPVVLDENFNSFTASGFAPTPIAGQLDSDVWRVVGLSDNANPSYGFTGPAGGDFGRGVINGSADPATAGVYAPSANGALVVQPTGAEFDANGFIEAKIQNTSGATATNFDVAFDWAFRNSGGRGDSLQLSYSTDGTTFTPVTAANFTTPVAAESATPAVFSDQHEAASLSGLNVASDGFLYLRWTHTGSTGSGNRDEVGIDNVVVNGTGAGGGTTPPTTTNVSVGDVTITEGDSGSKSATFTVTRSDTSGAFTVHYATADGTATTGDGDYVATAGDLTFAAGGPATQTVTVAINGDTRIEGNETFSLNLSDLVSTSGSAVLSTATGTGTIQNDDVALTRIYTIQGSGQISPDVGQAVTTQGVVTAISNGSTKGFYIQDVAGDGNTATSDGVFVFTQSVPTVHEGDLVNVTGVVQEFKPSGAAPGALSVTEIAGTSATPLAITTLSTGNALPAAVVIGDGPNDVHIPTSDIAAANATYKSLEGMLVTVDSPLVVGPKNSFGEIFTVASNGAGATGLNGRGDLLISGGAPVFGYTDSQGTGPAGTTGDQNPERIQIDPGLGVTLPNVNTGAHLGSVTGVVGYDFGDYQVLAKAAPTVTQASPLTKTGTTLTGDAGHLLVGSYNTENLDPGDGAARFATVASEILTKLNAPDVVALQEIQDNTGATDNGVTTASQTLQMIVSAINAQGGPTYAFIDNPFIGNDTNGGEPGGNIRTAFLYRTDRVGFVSGSLATVASNGSAIHASGDAATDAAANRDQQINPDNPFFQSRPPLSATFTFNGQQVTVLSDHFTSKGGSSALYGSDQPPFDAGEVTRAAQAQAVNTYVDGLLATNANAKVVVAGDLNDFGFEQPLSVLRGVATITNYDVPGSDPIKATATYTPGGAAILNDLQDTLPADQRFDYVYEGNAETLDHMLVTNALAAGAQFQPVHINSEFYDQTSDHDPLVASFAIAPQLTTRVTVSGQQSFTLASGGSLAVATGPAVQWNLTPATTGTNATVDNAGAISATSGRAIDTTGTQNGNEHFTLLNRAGASITSPGDAFRINSDLPNGVVVIDNAGTIRSTGTGSNNGQALDFNNIVSGSVSTTIINETGGIIAAADADAIRPGVNATINNHGQIIGASVNGSTGNDGIDFQDAGYGTIHNFTGGAITGARHGITGKLPIDVTNDVGATITGQLGSGINMDTASTSTTTVTNAGTISGHAAGASDGDAIDVDGLLTLNNHGLVEATGTGTGGLSEALAIGGGTINNYADGTIHSVQRAITVDDSNLGNAFAATTITNEGTIRGDAGEAISITGTFADTLTNKGVIVGSVALGDGNDTLNVYAGATFSGAIDGGAGTDTVNLEGSGKGSIAGLTNFETVNVLGGDWTLGSEGFATVNLTGGAQTLRLGAATLADHVFSGTIAGFGTDDLIDLKGIGTGVSATLDPSTNVLSVKDAAGGTLASLQLQGDFSGKTFSVSSDGDGGTALTQREAGNSLNILLTNDDGYNAPGITTLYNALVSAGFSVHIVAPAVNQSAQGSSLGGTAALNSPIAITEFSPGNYAVDGRPATAALVGVDDLFGGHGPDLIISGTNRGDNIGQSENISGTVNGALQGLFEGVPSIAISAGSFAGSYDAAFANSANFMVDFLHQLQAKQQTGQTLLPAGEALTINVPGNPILGGVAVTTVTAESSASFPYAPVAGSPNTYAEGFITNTAPSGSPTSEGSQFLNNHITISPIDGNWGATEADRDALAIRLGPVLNTAAHAGPLNILLLNEDGHNAAGITATRDALLAKGYNVTVLAPGSDQSGVGSALFLSNITVTQYDAKDFSANGTPSSLVSLGLDPNGLFHGARPDLVVVGADQGDAVGIENANHSATLGGAITALFNYGVPSIALNAESGTTADFATSATFLTTLIANLQASQGTSPTLLPTGQGLSINVPTGASATNYAITSIDAATDHNLSVTGDAKTAHFIDGGAIASTNPHSEGEAFQAGKITVSPIDGSFASHDPAAYASLADLVGTTYGTPGHAPQVLSFAVSEDAFQGDAQFVVLVNGQQIGGAQTVTASHAAGASQTVTLLDYFDTHIDSVAVKFINDLYYGAPTTDRNLYVDTLTLNGSVFHGENAVNNAPPATPSPADMAEVAGNGTLVFDTSHSLTLRVSEDAYQGDAQFIVTVDGHQVGGVQTVTASHAAGQYQDITLHGEFTNPNQVAVQFINDKYDGAPTTDRNLYVDTLTLNGSVFHGVNAVNNAPPATPSPIDMAEVAGNGTLVFDHLLMA